jgi:site-specific DNA-methyltransferase (adenine-specific)
MRPGFAFLSLETVIMSDLSVITGACIETMSAMDPGLVRVAFFDPPYNLGIDYGKGRKADRLPRDQYLDLLRCSAIAAKRLLTPDGSLWFLISPEWAGDVQCLLRDDVGLHWRETIIWVETFGVYCETKFGLNHRSLFRFTAHPKRQVFHPDRVPSDRITKYKDKRANPAGRVPGNVWVISRLCGTYNERLDGFPTQLPLELLRRIVKTASDPGDLVLDPFSGSATTGVVCAELARRYVGLEVDPGFAQRSRERLLAVQHQTG